MVTKLSFQGEIAGRLTVKRESITTCLITLEQISAQAREMSPDALTFCSRRNTVEESPELDHEQFRPDV